MIIYNIIYIILFKYFLFWVGISYTVVHTIVEGYPQICMFSSLDHDSGAWSIIAFFPNIWLAFVLWFSRTLMTFSRFFSNWGYIQFRMYSSELELSIYIRVKRLESTRRPEWQSEQCGTIFSIATYWSIWVSHFSICNRSHL